MIARLLISADPENIKKEIAALCGGIKNNHPDMLYFESGEKLGIAEARKIKEHFSLKPYAGKGRIAVLEDASVMTDEAQNALLKTIEELPENAVFIMGSASSANMLPTVLSRCEIICLAAEVRGTDTQDAEKLLSFSKEERFAFIENLKNRAEFLQALTAYFRKNITKYPDFTGKLLQAEEWAKQNVNIRAILEYLMLEMPSIK